MKPKQTLMPWIKKLIPVTVLGAAIAASAVILGNPPQAPKRDSRPAPGVAVETLPIKQQPLTVYIESFGIIEPRTQIKLLPEVGGRIIWLSSNFRDGGYIKKNEALVRLDPRDYEIQAKIAESAITTAKLALEEELARATQAKLDWDRLGDQEEPSGLVLRRPQVAAAQAAVQSAQAKLEQARLALERTEIKAPFSGRILSKQVDIGQIVTPSTELGHSYATDYIEVRLPVKNRDLAFLDLPESGSRSHFPEVTLENNLGAPAEIWHGKIIRTEAAIDRQANQLHVIAQINNPFETGARRPLKIGQYVNAHIEGRTFDNALAIPNAAIYQGSYVYILEEGLLKRREVALTWQDGTQALIATGIQVGDELVVTQLGQVRSGTRATKTAKQIADGKQL
jgi:RND family efflux transporter MFP subunit